MTEIVHRCKGQHACMKVLVVDVGLVVLPANTLVQQDLGAIYIIYILYAAHDKNAKFTMKLSRCAEKVW